MIDAFRIKAVLESVKEGTTLTVWEIFSMVERVYGLTKEDLEPYTQTRSTKYPRWKHRIQSVLANYKKEGVVAHNPSECSYTF